MAPFIETLAPSVYRSAAPVISFDEATQLAESYGTPLLAVSRSAVVRNYEAFRAGLPGVEMFYAAKANPDHLILSTLAEMGSSVDVCSYREAEAAFQAGFTADRMLHTHPCKTQQNMKDCYDAGIRWFTLDSDCEISKMTPYAADLNVMVRLSATSASSMINLSAKFGIHPDDAVALMLRAQKAGLNVRGMSFHVGSQCLSPDDFEAALRRARRVWDEATEAGIQLEVLDIGGGFPAPYRSQVLTLDSYFAPLADALESTFGDLAIRIIAEPGRGMCADTTTLVTKVIGKSMRSELPWYFLDDGLYGSFSGIVFDHADFPLMVANQEDRAAFPCVVAGPTCDSGDVITRDQMLPDLEVGELIMVPTMGAYSKASASGFNGLDIARSISVM